MVICDHVHRDPATLKCTVLGTFSSIGSSVFPAPVHLTVYFAITDGLGPASLYLQLIDANAGVIDPRDKEDQEGRVFLFEKQIEFSNPLVVVEGHISLDGKIPRPGQYHCELWAGDDVLMSRRLMAVELEGDEQ